MMTAQSAIARARRDLTVSTMLKIVLLGSAVVGLFLLPIIGLGSDGGMLVMFVVIGIWMVLSIRSMKGSRIAADSPSLIAAGQFDEAERRIEAALRAFSLFRTVKLLSLHHLALLRHAQRRYHDAATICRALLGERLGPMSGINKQSRLILADALLEVGDLGGAYEAILGLYQHRLTLAEALNLLQIELDYQSRIGAWEQMFSNFASKVQLAELLPAPATARAQALLALAAHKTGHEQWARFLRRRVKLLADVNELIRMRPILQALWRPNTDSTGGRDDNETRHNDPSGSISADEDNISGDRTT